MVDGSIVALLTDYELDAVPLRALYIPSPYVPAKIRSFIELMGGAVASNRSLTSSARVAP